MRRNDNIIGYSNPKVTTYTKNAVSTIWQLDLPSIYHKRFYKILSSLSQETHEIRFFYSYDHFFLKLFQLYGRWNATSAGETAYLKKNSLFDATSSRVILDNAMEESKHKPLPPAEFYLFDYYYYPELLSSEEIRNALTKADFLILPALYTGYSSHLLVFIHQKHAQIRKEAAKIEDAPAILFEIAAKFYYQVRKLYPRLCFSIEHEKFQKNGRIFTIKPEYFFELEHLCRLFYQQGVILNQSPPYYNYFPLVLDPHQIKKLKRIFASIR